MNERLREAINLIDDRYIDEAVSTRCGVPARRLLKLGTGVAAAVLLCLAAAGGILYKMEYPYPFQRVPLSGNSGEYVTYEYRIPHWDEMAVYDQYRVISLGGIEYSAGKGIVPKERLGRKLADVVVEGWDYYADAAGGEGKRFTNAAVYEIKEIASECAAAVRYDGTDVFYPAINHDYRPETLGQFIEDLDLQNTLSFGNIYYEHRKRSGAYASVVFENVDSGKIWEMLLAATDAPNEYHDPLHEPEKVLGISVSSPVFGFENASFSVYQDGYVITNIFASGKMFRIGEEHTQAFIDYVLKKCDGFETIYMEEESVPENGDEGSGSSPSYSPRK